MTINRVLLGSLVLLLAIIWTLTSRHEDCSRRHGVFATRFFWATCLEAKP